AGPGWEAIVHPEDAARAQKAWEHALAAGEIFDCEYRLRGADGNYRWFIGRNIPLKNERGHVVGWFGSATDIQALKNAEEFLQETDRRKNHFLAMLGHELRNPLAAIKNGVDLLRSKKSSPESRAAALPIVAQQVTHMEALVDDLLDLTRIVEGTIKVRKEPMQLRDALRRSLEMVRTQIDSGNYTVDFDDRFEPIEVLGDIMRLTQVFANILTNAIKYSGDSRRIEIALTQIDDQAAVRIRDFGQGIPPSLLPRIFDPFVQAKPGDTLQSGLGLGLAVVRKLVSLHGGHVTAHSEGEGHGSEFVVYLPLTKVPHESAIG
ncbi:MAG TPA: PAS domain-containing sensor histidine kinase, partial [Opitutaceae bacterium]